MQRIQHRFVAMGGPACFHIDTHKTELAQAAVTAAEKEVRRLERKYSRYLPDSVASRINAAAGSGMPLNIDRETAMLLEFANTLWSQSGQLFDPTSGILRRAWRFPSGSLPRQEELDALLPLVGWRRVQRAPSTVYLPEPGMELDFGGFVKEYAVDCAASVLQSMDIDSALVDLAGDMAAVGNQGGGRPWVVGIRGPGDNKRPVSWIGLSGSALASSGNYERFIECEDKRYGHILHPGTGWPVQGLAGASVTAPQCLVAGATATIAMLLPIVETLDWLHGLGLPWLAIDADDRLFTACYWPDTVSCVSGLGSSPTSTPMS